MLAAEKSRLERDAAEVEDSTNYPFERSRKRDAAFTSFKSLLIMYGFGILLISYLFSGWTVIFSSPPYSSNDIPDLRGKFAVVTGANTGIGKQTALEMARKGCHVIVTSRSEEKGGKAIFDLVGQTLFQTLNNPN